MPQSGKTNSNFSDDDIVKRAIRFGIQSRHKGSKVSRYNMVHNAIQIPAIAKKNTLDVWEFESKESPEIRLLQEILFRTTPNDGLDKENSEGRLVIELVVYVRDRSKRDK
jgi:hypothetical protein